MITTNALNWGTHLRGAEDGHNVGTDNVDRVTVRLLEVHQHHGLFVLEGPAGVGKSFSTARAAEELLARHPDLSVAHVELARSASGRSLLADLYEQITGVPAHRRATERELRTDLARDLRTADRLVVVDEAQHVSRPALLALRWMHDQPQARFTLALIGLNGMWGQLPREIQSRCSTRMVAERIPDDDTVLTLTEYHEIFGRFDPAVLTTANRRRARGEFRWWAKFLGRTLRYVDALPKRGKWDGEIFDQIAEDLP